MREGTDEWLQRDHYQWGVRELEISHSKTQKKKQKTAGELNKWGKKGVQESVKVGSKKGGNKFCKSVHKKKKKKGKS